MFDERSVRAVLAGLCPIPRRDFSRFAAYLIRRANGADMSDGVSRTLFLPVRGLQPATDGVGVLTPEAHGYAVQFLPVDKRWAALPAAEQVEHWDELEDAISLVDEFREAFRPSARKYGLLVHSQWPEVAKAMGHKNPTLF